MSGRDMLVVIGLTIVIPLLFLMLTHTGRSVESFAILFLLLVLTALGVRHIARD